MAYRNGTYVAFHANGTNVPTLSDIKYYNLLKAWCAKSDDDFAMINSHDKASAVRDTSKQQTLIASLLQRLRNSKNFLLIIGKTTRLDDDWVPFEIEYAVDVYKLPIIAAYVDFERVSGPDELSHLLPAALKERIDDGRAHVIHVPFKKEPLADAIGRFDHNNLPKGALTIYTREKYRSWGIP